MRKFSLLMFLISISSFGASVVMDPSLIDSRINPCDNFYQYACGNWLKNNDIPQDKPRFMRFIEREDDNKLLLKEILERYSHGVYAPKVDYADKLGSLYNSCMNKFSQQELSQRELNQLIKQIDELKSKDELGQITAKLHQKGIPLFFSFGAAADQMNAQKNIGYIDNSGITLPEKGYYTRSGSKDVETREKYKKHISDLLYLVGLASRSETRQLAQRVLAVESDFARITLSPVDYNDPKITYNKIGIEGIKQVSNSFNWDEYFKNIDLQNTKEISVTSKSYLSGFSDILKTTPIDDLKIYIKWIILNSSAQDISKELSDEVFDFRSRYMLGLEKRPAEWKTCVNYVDSVMGDALGAAYVIAVKFSPDSKTNVNRMIDNIIEELKISIQGLEWMDAITKNGALKKANFMKRKIGYPEKITDYSSFNVESDNYFGNSLQAANIGFEKNVAKVGKEVDHSQWEMTAPTLNAYYQPTANEIVFPAGILGIPHYSDEDTLMANYGATGAVIGHELSHAFDDQGSQYNQDGNLENWWTQFSSEEFEKRSSCLVKQYDSYEIQDGTHLNGKLTLGENIADLGGVKLAYKGLLRAKPDLTEDDKQAFFTSFAQVWCAKLRPEYAKKQVQTNPHSLPEFRVNGVLVNLPEFTEAFQCPIDSKMNNQNRCSVW